MDGFKEGYEYYAETAEAYIGAADADTYVKSVEKATEQLEKDLASFKGVKTPSKQLKGDIAEFWHADTFNIDAALKKSGSRAVVPRDHGFSSPDVQTTSGESYGLKYYYSGEASAKAQAMSVFERFNKYRAAGGKESLEEFLKNRNYDSMSVINDPIYKGQVRIIPADQFEEAKKWLERKIASENRPEQLYRYKETLKLLNTKISDGKGVHSVELTEKEARKLASLAKSGEATAKKLHMSVEELMGYEYIFKEAFASGVSAAMLSVVLSTAPEIFKAAEYLIQNGELDRKSFEKIGFAALKGSSEGFVRGFASAAVTTTCKSGLLGAAAKNISPSVIAAAVVIVMNTMKNSYKVSKGSMTRQELSNELLREIIVSSFSLAGGAAGQAAIEIPVFGFLLGSLVGTGAGVLAYEGAYRLTMSICTDTGFTMFGLVEQDYSLPEEVLRSIGIKTFEFKKHEFIEHKFIEHSPIYFKGNNFSPQTIDITVMKRGVIGVSKIGYVQK